MPFRSNASRNGPIGLCQAESFRNSFADSVSFRFPSWQSLDGHPVPPANYASGRATPASKSSANKKRKATGRLQACRLNASPRSVSYSGNYCPRNFAAAPHHRQWSVSLFFSLTFERSGGWKREKPAGRRPLDGRVRHRLATCYRRRCSSALASQAAASNS